MYTGLSLVIFIVRRNFYWRLQAVSQMTIEVAHPVNEVFTHLVTKQGRRITESFLRVKLFKYEIGLKYL